MDNEIAIRDRVAFNKGEILKGLKSIGATTATCHYSGEGDDGGSVDIGVYGPDNQTLIQADDCHVQRKQLKHQRVADKWVPQLVEERVSLIEAIENLCEDMIEQCGHGGWENGDGGGGSLTINTESENVELDHYDNIVEQHHSIHTA